MHSSSRTTDGNAPPKTALLAAALFVCLLLSPLPALAEHVIVIKDADIKPYRDALAGFKGACGCEVTEVGLSDVEDLLDTAATTHPDAVFALGTKALRKASAIRSLPVIYAMVVPTEAAALAADNVSGVSMDLSPETYLTTMTALFPDVKRIGVIYNPKYTGPYVEEALGVARARGVRLVAKAIHDPREAPGLLETLRGELDVLWMLPDPTLANSETVDYLMLFSFQNNMPVFSFSKKYVERGAVAALTLDPFEAGVQAAEIAQVMLKGGKHPVSVYAKNPRLSVNRKVASKIGVELNNDLVKKADKVE